MRSRWGSVYRYSVRQEMDWLMHTSVWMYMTGMIYQSTCYYNVKLDMVDRIAKQVRSMNWQKPFVHLSFRPAFRPVSTICA